MSTALATEITPKLLAFVKKAGKLALEKQANITPSLKSDNTVLTETDLAISKMCHETFAEYFALENHILIDEETISDVGTPADVIGKYEYMWVIDPIDGTMPYSNGLPFWGVSIGILKNAKPWVGLVYNPKLCELYLSDGEKSYFIDQPFTAEESKTEITPISSKAGHQTPCELGRSPQTVFNWDYSLSPTTTCNSAVTPCGYLTLGRISGYVNRLSVWDFAGIWPAMLAAGVDIRFINNSKPIQNIKIEELQINWKFKEFCVFSTQENYSTIKNALTKRNDIKTH